jgi:hypothetical protein
MKPSAEKILSTLIELYARQEGLEINYIIEIGGQQNGTGKNRKPTRKGDGVCKAEQKVQAVSQ